MWLCFYYMLMKSLLSFEITFLSVCQLLELPLENVARKGWGGGGKRSSRKGWGGGGGGGGWQMRFSKMY